MFLHTGALISILTLINLQDNLVSCGHSKCFKVPHRYTQLKLYKNGVNVPSNLKTCTTIGDDGEKLIVFEFDIPQKGKCVFRDKEMCLTRPFPENESCQKYINQSMLFVLPSQTFFHTYKVTSLTNCGKTDNDFPKYFWTSAYQCGIFSQEEDGHSLCFDFEHDLGIGDKKSFLTNMFDFTSIFVQPGCHPMQYVIGEKSGMFEFLEEITQHYFDCENVVEVELQVTASFPPSYKAEKLSWIWKGVVGTDSAEVGLVAGNKPWKPNALKFKSEDKSSEFIMKAVLTITMMTVVLDVIIINIYIWMAIKGW